LDVVTPFARGSILSAVNAGDARGKIGAAPLDSPALTGNPTAPTPTAGDNDTSVATTAFVTTAVAGKADTSALTAKADLASPTFTGDPHAPTPTAGDNDTSIATTAFVAAAIAAVSAGVTNVSDTPPGSPANGSLWWESDSGTLFISYNDGNTTQWVAIGGGTSIIALAGPPQGRLTLQTATPVMTATQAAKTTIFYTPYHGNLVPIYDGTNFSMSAFSELSALTTDATKSPAAIGASKVNDWFVWNDAGTLRLGHGPDWTNDTTRSAGTALVMVNGILLNNASITNGPAAQRGTYVGTTRSNASSQLDWMLSGSAATGSPLRLGVWNMYNRATVQAVTRDTADHVVSVTPFTPAGTPNTNITFVSGLAEDAFDAVYHTACFNNTTTWAMTAIGLDGVAVGSKTYAAAGIAVAFVAQHGDTALGAHVVAAMEATGGANVNFMGNGGTLANAGLRLRFRM
jgi:hypothetical protein